MNNIIRGFMLACWQEERPNFLSQSFPEHVLGCHKEAMCNSANWKIKCYQMEPRHNQLLLMSILQLCFPKKKCVIQISQSSHSIRCKVLPSHPERFWAPLHTSLWQKPGLSTAASSWQATWLARCVYTPQVLHL